MDMVEEYLEKHKVGFPTFEKLFNLKQERLIEVLKDVCADHKEASEVLNEKPNSYKFIENDEPTKIKLCSWSTIEITPIGIYYKPEHGIGKDVVLFNKYFKLSLE